MKKLTPREIAQRDRTLLILLARGRTKKQISEETAMTHSTACRLVKELVEKRGFQTESQMMFHLGVAAVSRRSNLP